MLCNLLNLYFDIIIFDVPLSNNIFYLLFSNISFLFFPTISIVLPYIFHKSLDVIFMYYNSLIKYFLCGNPNISKEFY